MAPLKKILWAIDPHEEPSELQLPMRMLKYLLEETGSVIQPAYMITGETESESRTRMGDESDLLKNLLPPQVVHSFGSKTHSDLIVANTHGWSGFRRIFRGRFVHQLLLHSPIPVMILGPEVKEVHPFDRVIYATHLDKFSKKGFREAVEVAEKFGSEVTVLHLLSRRQRDQDGENSTAVGESLPPRSHLMRRALAWKNWASRKGIDAEILLKEVKQAVRDLDYEARGQLDQDSQARDRMAGESPAFTADRMDQRRRPGNAGSRTQERRAVPLGAGLGVFGLSLFAYFVIKRYLFREGMRDRSAQNVSACSIQAG